MTAALLLSGCGGNETTVTTATTTTTNTQTTTATATTTTTTTSTTHATTSTTTPADDDDKYGGIYHYALSVAPATPLGYPVESAPDAMLIFSLALERLLLIGDGGAVTYPRLAESWDIDVAANTMTFHLRKGVKFTDGWD